MKRILLVWELTHDDGLFAALQNNRLPLPIETVINCFARLDTAWIDLVVEIPATIDPADLAKLTNSEGNLGWLHFLNIAPDDLTTARLSYIRELGADAIGFIEGNEVLPKEAVFRWSEVSQLAEGILDRCGVLMASLPTASVVSSDRIVSNVHYAEITSATVAFFTSDHVTNLIETPRADWFTTFAGVSNVEADSVLVICQDWEIKQPVSTEHVEVSTAELIQAVTRDFEIDADVIENFWAGQTMISSM